MISRYSYLLYIATFSFLLVAISASTTSLWFLRGVLGASQGVVEVGYKQDNNIEKMIKNTVLPVAGSYLHFSPNTFSRLVYLQDRTVEYVVGIPTLQSQLGATSTLSNVGWKTSRIGWIVIGKRQINGSIEENQNERSASLVSGVSAELSAVFQHGLSANPLFFSKGIPGFASVESGFAVYGDQKKHEVRISLGYNSQQFIKIIDSETPLVSMQNDTLYVAIQRGIMRFLPKEFTSAITATIDQRFHFTKTSPSLLGGIPADSLVGIFTHGNDIAMGVTGGASGFRDSVVKYIQSEQGARHPIRKGFLLPDGTVGHEYVPANPTISFEKTDDTNCEKAVGYDEQLFMCSNSLGGIDIATSLDAAQKAIQNLKEGNRNVWGSGDAEALKNILQENAFQKIWFSGDDKSLMISGAY
ncbi:MAG: hypothetical protein K8Q97_03255 [Candidatus Andersenbacteria bacterium]|nr:hypothetical protein [Candidatus Andersenbacteria bacterium]